MLSKVNVIFSRSTLSTISVVILLFTHAVFAADLYREDNPDGMRVVCDKNYIMVYVKDETEPIYTSASFLLEDSEDCRAIAKTIDQNIRSIKKSGSYVKTTFKNKANFREADDFTKGSKINSDGTPEAAKEPEGKTLKMTETCNFEGAEKGAKPITFPIGESSCRTAIKLAYVTCTLSGGSSGERHISQFLVTCKDSDKTVDQCLATTETVRNPTPPEGAAN